MKWRPHLKNYAHLLHADPDFAARATRWSQKLKDIHEWLAEIGVRRPACGNQPQRVTYHESCHLCHGQKVVRPPREVLNLESAVER
jgi:glycolate oxidase iron-sulfur subunit